MFSFTVDEIPIRHHLKPLLRGLNGMGGLYRPSELRYTPVNIAFNIIQTVQSPLIYQFYEIKNLK